MAKRDSKTSKQVAEVIEKAGEYFDKMTFRPYSSEDHPKTKGFLTVEIDSLTLYGMTIIEGERGPFISFPSRKGKDGKGGEKYYPEYFMDPEGSIYKELLSAVKECL